MPTTGTENSSPDTEEGKILLREHTSGTQHMVNHIRAIENEAREELREQVAKVIFEHETCYGEPCSWAEELKGILRS